MVHFPRSKARVEKTVLFVLDAFVGATVDDAALAATNGAFELVLDAREVDEPVAAAKEDAPAVTDTALFVVVVDVEETPDVKGEAARVLCDAATLEAAVDLEPPLKETPPFVVVVVVNSTTGEEVEVFWGSTELTAAMDWTALVLEATVEFTVDDISAGKGEDPAVEENDASEEVVDVE